MTLAAANAALLWAALTTYAVLAGADFGGGVWDLLASGPRAAQQRRAVAEAMGPVWEANHVWLIFLVVGFFTAFPPAFAVLALALYLPLTLALVGIILRGAAFAFRAHGAEAEGASRWGLVFGSASLLAPFFLGAAAADVAAGHVHANGRPAGVFEGWATPEALLIGLLAVSLCAYLAATYLLVETADRPDLQADFRRRALGAGALAGVLAIATLALARSQAPRLFETLTGNGLPLLVLAILNGGVALWTVWRTRPRVARAAVIAQVVLVIWAWPLGQWPYLVPPDLTVAGSAAPSQALQAMLVVTGVGMALLAPSLWYLFHVFKGRLPQA
ncbi:MAG: cytochrome d ubiquinol oxidase subunit II [Chloroflexi bacterium]|nr:MAG: cytochrome d ubiquinol oxidase subunit II [Chloroflexota bacterium]